ncbi:MAG: NAD(P)(+) transhydrogenase (Re/Si-specific) subunit beta, partial [Pseudomonadota bacterium]|nr:NAD(P)(+) transhydrogenase (Re/Si-specific) subunit beta [Pseudomonadota bacterium]
MTGAWLTHLISASYFIAALLFILGLKRMSSPRTARGGILWAGVGMLLAVLVTFFLPGMQNLALIGLALVIGVAAAWVSGKRVAMTNMPQMVALYNGMGGGAAAAIGATELLHFSGGGEVVLAALHFGGAPVLAIRTLPPAPPLPQLVLAVVGALIGAVSFSGSLIAFAKLQGWMDRRFVFAGQQGINLLALLGALLAGALLIAMPHSAGTTMVVVFFALALAFGLLMTLPIGGADMPVVISLYNAFTGLAVAFEGFVLHNELMIIAGMVVGAAGTLLTQLMAKAMNRSIGNV